MQHFYEPEVTTEAKTYKLMIKAKIKEWKLKKVYLKTLYQSLKQEV